MNAFAYGLPALGLYAMQWVVSLYLLKFATEQLLLAPALVGAILAASRVWDAVNDPLVGIASDHTRTRLGRRRPWMLGGAPLVACAFVAIWWGPGAVGSTSRSVWFAAATFSFYTAFTLVSIPHSSLGASLATGNGERNRLFAARGLFQNLGLAVAMAALYGLEKATNPESAARWIGVALGVLATATIAAGALLTNEPRSPGGAPRHGWRSMLGVARDADTRRILATLGLQELALGSLLVVLPFASDAILDTPGGTAVYLLAFIAAMTLSLPVWVTLARRFGVKRAWCLGNAIEALAFVPLVRIEAGDLRFVIVMAAMIGCGHGASRILSMTALATAADRNTRTSGEAMEGMIFAASTFVEKCAVGCAALAVGFALQLSGLETGPDGVAAGGEATALVLRALASVFPAVLLTLSCLVLAGGDVGGRRKRARTRALPCSESEAVLSNS